MEQESNFILDIINKDLDAKKNDGKVVTRFPPEPNGYLHIGHAKAICLNFGVAENYKGTCNLRFDDTNPEKEEQEYVDSIMRDIKWLGFDWNDRLFYTSDYYDRLYQYAIELIGKGKAYVCSLSPDEIRKYRGTLTEPGKNSPYRDRPIDENLELFRVMKEGKCKDGEHVLRARIDMASPNINMRDPAIYRLKHEFHHRTGDKWCIYPMYDFAHSLSDSIEGITHSLCTLEFENHRPLYDWFLNELDVNCHPRQIEFARLNLSNTIMSKRKLQQLIDEKFVSGWDDPRMPSLAALRRRGYNPKSIRAFCDRIGISKVDSVIDVALLEHFVRDDLNKNAPRVMVVLRPLKIVIDNYPDDKTEELDAINNPEDEAAGSRKIPFSKVVYIEMDDFHEDPPKKFFRLAPGREIRLKHAYYIKCESVVKDEAGEIVEVHCTYDPKSRGGWAEDGRRVKGTAHWVSAAHAIKVDLRLYDHLLTARRESDMKKGSDFKEYLNPRSLEILTDCLAEPGLSGSKAGATYQFLRQGYFCTDPDSTEEKLVFNRTATLKDTWSRTDKGQRK